MNYLYNGVKLPEFPPETAGYRRFIRLLDDGTYMLYCWPAGTIIEKLTTGSISANYSVRGWKYTRYTFADGAWGSLYQSEAQIQLTIFAAVWNIIWTSQSIRYESDHTLDGIYIASSEPVPAPPRAPAPDPASLLHGWIMGRKTARMRRPQ